jgi:CubicO group peptidase (beta-lactamase class C family)
MRNTLFIISVLALVAVSCGPQTGDFTGANGLEPSTLEDIDRVVSAFMPNYEYINIGLVRDEAVLLTKTYGQNRLKEVDFYASVSKPLTAMILAQLLEEEKIASVDDEIQDYSPTYRDVQPTPYDDTPITFKHLLIHQSGVPHLGELWSDGKLIMAFRPGSRIQYSTLGYGILGDVLEEITGRTYDQLVKERIGRPVGARSFKAGRHFTAPGGQVRSTIHDMALFAIGTMGGQYVSHSTLQELMFREYGRDEYGPNCLGWRCADLNSRDVTLYHAGSNGRPRAYLRIKPLKKVAVAITAMKKSDHGPYDLEQLSIELMEVLETPSTLGSGTAPILGTRTEMAAIERDM